MNSNASTAEREIATSRLLDFPRELVFLAFRDPNQLMHWWGPNGFTNTFEEFDFRTGGNWRFVMHGPNGANFPNHHVFAEISAPGKIVFRHLSNPRFHLTVTLRDESGKTRIDWNMLFDSAGDCTKVKEFVVPANEQNLDRLTAQLAKMKATNDIAA